ncbi:polysaccharide deacetylase family protein [Sulfobacillus harzensis]|uniref:Polysaccharide deacetylase family protein n=1 Tax=Sulfobacillus harzensis TaxID=2729629 RepID=A0A7Y0Q2E8_9FIRM|nr:polysaccharide deacetylase family protein [Sulfobacillus harzensis]NMP21841.1 polysaccharide deacetylase family protein [Sulfobacillus harzensis]
MHFRVISLRGPLTRLAFLGTALILATWLINPRLHATVAPVAKPIPVYRVETDKAAMALTINVVWGTEYVPKLLAELKAAHVPATFMVGGAWAEAHPELVRTMRKDGDEIGNHGWNHRHPNQLGYQGNIQDITRTNHMIEGLVQVRPKVYAPPYGEFNGTVLKAAQAAHMTLVMWTIDTIDWRPSSSVSYMVGKVGRKAENGAIVLMHPTDRTVEALPQIIATLKEKGYQLVTVSELLTMGTPRTDER